MYFFLILAAYIPREINFQATLIIDCPVFWSYDKLIRKNFLVLIFNGHNLRRL